MASKKSLLSTTAFSLALGVGLVTIPHLPTLASSQPAPLGNRILSPWQVSLTSEPPIAKRTAPVSTIGKGTRIFEPPDGKAPSTTGGAARGSGIIEEENSIIPLMPKNNLVLTVSEYPTFFFYLPKSTAQTARFTLVETAENPTDNVLLYEKTFNIPSTPSIVSVGLPNAALSPLKVGKTYQWFLMVLSDTDDFSGNPRAEGWIERIQPNPTLAAKLEKTSPGDRPRVYGKAGIWQETLTTLAQLRRSNPNDAKISADWEKLLNEVGLSAVTKEPLVDCCTVEN